MVTFWRMQVTHILQDAAARRVIQHVVGGDGRHPHAMSRDWTARTAGADRWAAGAARAPDRRGRRRPRAAAQAQRAVLVGGRPARGPRSAPRHRRRGPPKRDRTCPCRRASCRARAAGRAAHRPVDRSDRPGPRYAVAEIEPAADHQADARGLGGLVGAHDAGERIAIDDAERFDAHERPRWRIAPRMTKRRAGS